MKDKIEEKLNKYIEYLLTKDTLTLEEYKILKFKYDVLNLQEKWLVKEV